MESQNPPHIKNIYIYKDSFLPKKKVNIEITHLKKGNKTYLKKKLIEKKIETLKVRKLPPGKQIYMNFFLTKTKLIKKLKILETHS